MKIATIYNMGISKQKKYLTNILGHKVNEIVSRQILDTDTLYIRFRHHEVAYSNMYIKQVGPNIRHYLENFETGELEPLEKEI